MRLGITLGSALAMTAVGIALAEGITETIEISAPIFPKVLVLYAAEGANYPPDPTGQEALAHDAALTYETLLTECAASYPLIALQVADGAELSPAQLATNYKEVARCAYEQFTSKPYWIPKLVDDVDICGLELGAEWRLISETDLKGLRDADFQFLAQTLSEVGQDIAGLYFSLQVYVRADDGTIKGGDLSPGVTSRVFELPVGSEEDLKNHLEGGFGLRCIRRQ